MSQVGLDEAGRRYSITRRGHRSTRTPQTAAEKSAPLHVAAVPPMRLKELRARMKPEVQRRFDRVWEFTFFPMCDSTAECAAQSDLDPEHSRLLEEHGIARRASGPGPYRNVPFTVFEEKESGARQRFILWTKDGNQAAEEAGYEASVPLEHVSRYLDAVHEECGSTRDFKTGFFAIEIPPESRFLFRFVDRAGSWWELTRLPMGHSCAPEIMHTVAAAAAGHPDYVLPQFAITSVKVHVWVDNIRYAGPRSSVVEATRLLDETASECVLTWKTADSRTAETAYSFIGVEWDHKNGRVAVSDRLKVKLVASRASVASGFMKAHELETLGGRLLHASAIAGVFPGAFYFGLKFLRRVTNSLNRGTRVPDTLVRVSPCVVTSLSTWIDAVVESFYVPTPVKSPRVTAFVDASLSGWGGVIVDSRTGEVSILGSQWSEQEKKLHINELEAKAFFIVVTSLPHSVVGGNVTVVVDNTTVQAVSRKGMCVKSRVLNDAVVGALRHLRAKQCSLSVKWVRSADNPADAPSRMSLKDMDEKTLERVSLATRRFFTREVVVGL